MKKFYSRTKRVGDCLVWTAALTGSTSKAGCWYVDGVQVRAHRWIYEQLVGPIPEGWDVDHVRVRGCKFTMCVEITHLEAVPHRENMRRARLDVCRSGRHDLTNPDNVRWDSRGFRRGCKLCHGEKATISAAARRLRKQG